MLGNDLTFIDSYFSLAANTVDLVQTFVSVRFVTALPLNRAVLESGLKLLRCSNDMYSLRHDEMKCQPHGLCKVPSVYSCHCQCHCNKDVQGRTIHNTEKSGKNQIGDGGTISQHFISQS